MQDRHQRPQRRPRLLLLPALTHIESTTLFQTEEKMQMFIEKRKEAANAG